MPVGDEPGATSVTNQLPVLNMLPALAAYFAFGVGYFVYMTFLVAWMRAEGEGLFLVMLTWSLLSIMVIFSPYIWRYSLSRSAAGGAIALTLLFTGIGSFMPVVHGGASGMLVSAVLFGAAFFMVPTAVTSFSKKNLPADQWGSAVSLFTTVFAIGQMIGPATAGAVADWTSSLAPGLASSGVVLVLGAVVAMAQRPLRRDGY
jgi:predicted MFS family arabinose efflux permease